MINEWNESWMNEINENIVAMSMKLDLKISKCITEIKRYTTNIRIAQMIKMKDADLRQSWLNNNGNEWETNTEIINE